MATKKAGVRTRVVIQLDEENFPGPGRIELLEKIREHASISQAAAGMGMSYRKA